MSDTTEPSRDADSGQFTPSTEGLYGRDLQLAEAGWHPRKDATDEHVTPDYLAEAGEDPVRQAAQELKESRHEPLELSAAAFLGEGDAKEALTVRQAADDLASAGAELSRYVEGADLDKYAEEVDQRRAEIVKGDKKVAEALGLDEVPKDPELTKAERAEADAIDAVDGLDPETRKALRSPQIRAAVEAEFSKAEQATHAYSQGLEHANTYSHAAILAIAPELQGVPLDRWQEGIQLLAQADPARGQQLGNLLQYVGQIQGAQQQAAQHKAAVEHQQIETWAKAEDARLKTMGVEVTNEVANEVADYAKSLGIDRGTLGNAMLAHPILRSAEVQAMMVAAAKYHALTKSPAKAAPKTLPPVQKPGTSNAVRASAESSKVHALEAQLASARGDKAVRLAAKLASMRRA